MDLSQCVERLFSPARRPGRVGAEVELIPVTDTPRPRPVEPRVLAGGFDAAFVAEAVPSFEPGGQLELSPAPRPTALAMVGELRRLLGRATKIASARGVRLETVGVNPYHSCADVPLRTPSPRYLAMQRAFDEVGPDGRRMMRLTASLQITVDLLPGRAGHEQWLVANLAGPPLTAAFSTTDGSRTRIWQGVDLRRTAYDGRRLDLADPVGAYQAFAAAAPRLPIPQTAEPGYHLSTLFPPVRPRGGYLEVRYLDAQPPWRIGDAITTVATLLYDAKVRRAAPGRVSWIFGRGIRAQLAPGCVVVKPEYARYEGLTPPGQEPPGSRIPSTKIHETRPELLLPRIGDQHRAWSESAAGCAPESQALLEIAGSALITGGVS